MSRTMKTTALVAAVIAVAASTPADAFSEKVKKACAADYASLCSQYRQSSPQLRRCFQSNRKVLSDNCARALVNAGEVPARYRRR
jgi:hypothetical protein